MDRNYYTLKPGFLISYQQRSYGYAYSLCLSSRLGHASSSFSSENLLVFIYQSRLMVPNFLLFIYSIILWNMNEISKQKQKCFFQICYDSYELFCLTIRVSSVCDIHEECKMIDIEIKLWWLDIKLFAICIVY